jgi:hypothetical protein
VVLEIRPDCTAPLPTLETGSRSSALLHSQPLAFGLASVHPVFSSLPFLPVTTPRGRTIQSLSVLSYSSGNYPLGKNAVINIICCHTRSKNPLGPATSFGRTVNSRHSPRSNWSSTPNIQDGSLSSSPLQNGSAAGGPRQWPERISILDVNPLG